MGRIRIRVEREGKRLKKGKEGLMGREVKERTGEGLMLREGTIVVIIINK